MDEERLRSTDRFQTLLYSILKLWLILFPLKEPEAVRIFSVL